MTIVRLSIVLSFLFVASPLICSAQTRARSTTEREYPKEIRGYKLERARIELKQDKKGGTSTSQNAVITFGEAKVVSITPLGVTLEIPIVIAAVKQKGHVDFLSFYDITINGTHVDVDDYNGSFDLPNEHSLILGQPITVFVAMPAALLGAVRDRATPKETWPVTGVAYVFGQFKKWIFKGKRVVPVELDLQMRNPLRGD